MKSVLIAMVAAAALCGCASLGGSSADADKNVRESAAAAVRGAAVTVEWYFRLVPGQAPLLDRWNEYEERVSNESGSERFGFLMDPTTVIAQNPEFDLANIRSVVIRSGARRVEARIDRFFYDHTAILLKLEKPLDGVKPLSVDPEAGEPAFFLALESVADRDSARFAATVGGSVKDLVREWDNGEKDVPYPDDGVAVFDEKGRVCGFGYNRAAADEPVDPAQWSGMDFASVAADEEKGKSLAASVLRPVLLTFRSPKKELSRRRGASNELTELRTIGLLAGGKRILIDLNGERAAIPRLTKIQVVLPGRTVVEASFVGVHRMADFLVADLPEPVASCPVSTDDPTTTRDRLLRLVRTETAGTGRIRQRTGLQRVQDLDHGWRDWLVVMGRWNSFDLLLTPSGQVAWIGVPYYPLDIEIGSGGGNHRSNRELYLFTASDACALANPPKEDLDPLCPVDKEDEGGAIGWIGLDLQPLDEDLAEAFDLVEETESGEYGAIVTRVHPGSSADKAGVREDWILLSVKAADDASPRRVSLSESTAMFLNGFPWEQLGEIPTEYLSEFPPPWPAVNNALTEQLFKIGEGKDVEAEFMVDGKRVVKSLRIEAGPKHFGNTGTWKWEAGGLTVGALTFEVREYFNLAEDAPGVIITKGDPNGRATTAGIRRFEVIRRVNGKEVRTPAEFEKAVSGEKALSLEVLRMDKTRIVQFTLP